MALDHVSTTVSPSELVPFRPTTVDIPDSQTSVSFMNTTSALVELSPNATLSSLGALSIETPTTALSYPNGTPVPFYVNATSTRRGFNATCTINIFQASLDYFYPPTYSHPLGTMTTAAPNFTNADSYTLIPHTTTFDVASALEYDYACSTSESYVSEWDWTMTLCVEYTDKPSATATSVVYRSAAAPWPSGGLIPIGDALLYDLYTDGRPSATATISAAPNVTYTETSATPFVYFTAYEVESGNKTETVQLRSAQAYPYWLKGIENEVTATGPLPEGFIDQIPQSACDAGQLQATITVLIVVDLYYQNWPNANPFLVHFESTAIGFDDPPVVVNNQGTLRGQPLTIADWDLPSVNAKPTSTSIKPQGSPLSIPTTAGSNNNNNNNMFNAGGAVSLLPDEPQPSRATIGAIGTNPLVIGPSSEVVVDSQTLRPGGPAITVGGGTIVSLVPSATAIVIGGVTSQLPQVFNPAPQPTVRPPPILTIGSTTLTPNAATQFFIAPGQTLTPGGIATVDGTVVSLAQSASFLVIEGSTQVLPITAPGVGPSATSPPQIVVGGSTITAEPMVGGIRNPSNSNSLGSQHDQDADNDAGPGPTFIVSGQTLAAGGSAITVSGTTLSLAASGSFVVVNGVTSSIATPAVQASTPPLLTVGGSVFSPLPGSGTTFVVGDQTLAPGSSAITVSGTAISLGSAASFVVMNGVTSTLSNAAPQITPPPLTIGDSVFTPLPGTATAYVISSMLLTPGGSIVIAGATISLGATALIVNGQTSLITSQRPVITNPPLLTIGSQTYTAAPETGTTFVINGQTLMPGGTITVDGTTINLALGATELIYGSSGRSTTTALFPATTTRSQSVTGVLSPSAGASGSDGQAAVTSQRPGSSASKFCIQRWILSIVLLVLGSLVA